MIEILYNIEPTIEVTCKRDTEANLDSNALFLAQYWLEPSVEVTCITRCEDGTVWDEECQDCVPVCFSDVLAMLQIINAKLPAKIIG